MRDRTIEALWRDAPASTTRFAASQVAHLPVSAQRYFLHTLAPGARCSSSVRIAMHGSVDSDFDGLTIPTEYRVGWYFGSDRFESEGEFFRCTLDSLEQR